MPRVFLIETEYQVHMVRAQADWVRGLLGELAAGTLSGTAEWRHWHETGEVPEKWERLEDRFQEPAPAEEGTPATDHD